MKEQTWPTPPVVPSKKRTASAGIIPAFALRSQYSLPNPKEGVEAVRRATRLAHEEVRGAIMCSGPGRRTAATLWIAAGHHRPAAEA